MMRMNGTIRIVAAVLAFVAAVVWALLPVLSFTFIVPLFSLNGCNMAYYFSQITFVCFLCPLLMMLAPLCNDKRICIGAGALDIIMCVVVMICKSQIIIGGNLRWLYNSASLLIGQISSVAGIEITEANLQSYIQIACDNFLVPGIGFILHLVITFVYLLLAALTSEAAATANTVVNRVINPRATTGAADRSNTTQSYRHRT